MSTGWDRLLATDDTFAEVADLLFGGGADELFSKMNPTQSDVAAEKDKRNRTLTAGLSAVGAAAGGAGLLYGGHKIRGAYKVARGTAKVGRHATNVGRHAGVTKPMSRKGALKHALGEEKLATGLVPLEVAGLTGEIAATKILHGDVKGKKKIQKMSGRQAAALGTGAALAGGGLAVGAVAADNKRHGRKWNQGAPRTPSGKLIKKSMGNSEIMNNAKVPTKGSLTLAAITDPRTQKKGVEYARKGAGVLKKVPNKQITTNKVEKRDEVDVVWEGEIAKADPDKQQIFGWASVIEMNGEPIVDLQGDVITADEMEKAAYEYVMKSRKGGDMHLRDNWDPIQKSEMIESFTVTPEKRTAMGLPDSVPTGWWVGFKVNDDEVWGKVKSGERTGFSIHGRGKRTPL